MAPRSEGQPSSFPYFSEPSSLVFCRPPCPAHPWDAGPPRAPPHPLHSSVSGLSLGKLFHFCGSSCHLHTDDPMSAFSPQLLLIALRLPAGIVTHLSTLRPLRYLTLRQQFKPATSLTAVTSRRDLTKTDTKHSHDFTLLPLSHQPITKSCQFGFQHLSQIGAFPSPLSCLVSVSPLLFFTSIKRY